MPADQIATLERPEALPAGDAPLLEVSNLQKYFRRSSLFGRGGRPVRAVDGVSLELKAGKTLGLVGESGCGKTTTGRLLVRLDDPTGGTVRLGGTDCTEVSGGALKAYRRRVQMVFQDPSASLDPKMKVGESIAEPLVSHGEGSRQDRRDRIGWLMNQVGLSAEMATRFPHQLSGGQKQRVGIARALALSPEIIVADEPTSALDVSVRAQVVNLLRDLQRDFGISFLFISHDLSTVRYISDDVAVMYLGKVVERGPAEELFGRPLHPYTKALLAAVPVPDPLKEANREVLLLEGEVPSPSNPPAGCRFSTRCPLVTDRCRTEEPELRDMAGGRAVACHLL